MTGTHPSANLRRIAIGACPDPAYARGWKFKRLRISQERRRARQQIALHRREYLRDNNSLHVWAALRECLTCKLAIPPWITSYFLPIIAQFRFQAIGTYGGLLSNDVGGPNGIRTRVFSPPRAFVVVANS